MRCAQGYNVQKYNVKIEMGVVYGSYETRCLNLSSKATRQCRETNTSPLKTVTFSRNKASTLCGADETTEHEHFS